MGVVPPWGLPTYPEGFPDEVVDLVKAASGRGVICNRTRNGIQAIEEFGARHLEGGELIVYTSQDSVLQIAAHVDLVGPEELYAICRRVRASLPPQHAVGRVIARPFTGAAGCFRRTDGRRDFSIRPPARSYLEELHDSGLEVSCSVAWASTCSTQDPPTRPRCATPPNWCEAFRRGWCSPT
jgi:phosphopentomutase